MLLKEHPNSVIVGDYNFDSSWKAEESVITDNGFEDIVHKFIDCKKETMLKTPRFPAWRPDKIVCQ